MVRSDASELDSEDEGLEILLGGMDLVAVSLAAWDDEEVVTLPANNDTMRRRDEASNAREAPAKKVSLLNIEDLAEGDMQVYCDRAFHCAPNGQLVRPPVRIVDMSSVNNRGNGLVATRRIRKGEVVFTENAIEASQLPFVCSLCQDAPKEPWHSIGSVRACQNCFRSLEPISSIGDQLPMPDLWPVPEFQDGCAESDRYRTDSRGRIQCISCHALFCSKPCKVIHDNRMGSCCDCSSAVIAVVHALHPEQDFSDGDTEAEIIDLQPAVIIAARMFVSLLHRYRFSGELGLGPFEGLCGSEDDTSCLELGLEEMLEGGTRRYTLKTTFDAVCNVLTIVEEEKNHFTLELFQLVAAIAARNGFAIMTQSPFRAYHEALLRAAGGRGSDRHAALIRQVATALGSEDGTLQRDMDRKVEEKCAVEVVALFSLTARINHSCDPCAEVRSQEFVDCHIDLVAKRDILKGEEITISYINVGRTAGRGARDRTRRMRELRAKYLFDCDCALCSNTT